jgi:hypothetical protein
MSDELTTKLSESEMASLIEQGRAVLKKRERDLRFIEGVRLITQYHPRYAPYSPVSAKHYNTG